MCICDGGFRFTIECEPLFVADILMVAPNTLVTTKMHNIFDPEWACDRDLYIVAMSPTRSGYDCRTQFCTGAHFFMFKTLMEMHCGNSLPTVSSPQAATNSVSVSDRLYSNSSRKRIASLSTHRIYIKTLCLKGAFCVFEVSQEILSKNNFSSSALLIVKRMNYWTEVVD